MIDNTTNNKTLFLSGQGNVWGNLTINPGTTLNTVANTLLQIGPTITNNGAIVPTTTNTGSVNFAGSQQTLNGGYAQTYTGTGTVGTGALRLANVAVQNAPGVTIDPSVSALNVNRINAFYGAITNADKIADRRGRCHGPGRPARRNGHPLRSRELRRVADVQHRHRRADPGLFAVAGRDEHRARDPEQPHRAQHPDHQPDRRHAGGRRPDIDRPPRPGCCSAPARSTRARPTG